MNRGDNDTGDLSLKDKILVVPICFVLSVVCFFVWNKTRTTGKFRLDGILDSEEEEII